MSYQYLMFDLDGTITDSGHAIMSSVSYALDHMGITDQPEDKLRRFVGPSLMDSFRGIYGMNDEDASEAVRLYRSIYEGERMYEVTLYPGIVDVLRTNIERGQKNILVTSKAHVFAEKILERLGLSDLFIYQTGPEFDDHSSEKVRLINKAMKDLGLDPDACIMTGDTHFDIDGAVLAGIDSIGVTYGYGTRAELELAQANYIVDRAEDLLPILG